MDLQTPERVAQHFMNQPRGRIPEAQRPRLGAGRGHYVQSHAGGQSMNAKQMRSIGDRKDAVQMILSRDGSEPGGRFFRVGALRFGDDLVLRDLVGEQVVMADAPFRVARAALTSAQSDYQGSEAFTIKHQGMIESSAQHR